MMAPHDPTAERERAYSRQALRAAYLLMAKFGPDAYDEACCRFALAWRARTDEPGDEVAWWLIAEAIRTLEGIAERAC